MIISFDLILALHQGTHGNTRIALDYRVRAVETAALVFPPSHASMSWQHGGVGVRTVWRVRLSADVSQQAPFLFGPQVVQYALGGFEDAVASFRTSLEIRKALRRPSFVWFPHRMLVLSYRNLVVGGRGWVDPRCRERAVRADHIHSFTMSTGRA